MGSTKLKDDLNNCLITFDSKVLLTQLLDEYKLSHNEVNQIVGDFVSAQEQKQKLKYEKYYVVHGEQQNEDKVTKEIYKIVLEAKLKEWLAKLNNAESSLYAVEVSGGAKAPAAIFKPMSMEEGVKLKQRAGAKAANVISEKPDTSNSGVNKQQIKTESKKPTTDSQTHKQQGKDAVKIEKKTPVKATTSPQETKKSGQKKPMAAQKGSIGNFFAANMHKKSEAKDTKDSSKSSGVVKPTTPKKMQDFFKKQAEKPNSKTETLKTPAAAAANTSVQLFADEEESEDPEVVSSDEEEKLDALKRDLVSSDVEMIDAEVEDEETEETKPAAFKRRRILDSDDDEEDDKPPEKHEKLDEKSKKQEEEDVVEITEESPQESQTYLDEEGFVITIKPKKKSSYIPNKKSPAAAATSSKKSPTKKVSPTTTKKISPKAAIAAAAAEANKKKQPKIMNFFTKK